MAVHLRAAGTFQPYKITETGSCLLESRKEFIQKNEASACPNSCRKPLSLPVVLLHSSTVLGTLQFACMSLLSAVLFVPHIHEVARGVAAADAPLVTEFRSLRLLRLVCCVFTVAQQCQAASGAEWWRTVAARAGMGAVGKGAYLEAGC